MPISPLHPRKLRLGKNQSVLLYACVDQASKRAKNPSEKQKRGAKRKLTFLGQLNEAGAIRERLQAVRHGSTKNLVFKIVCSGCGKGEGHKRNCPFHSSNLPPVPPFIPPSDVHIPLPEPSSIPFMPLEPLILKLKLIAVDVFKGQISKLLLDSPNPIGTRKNGARPLPYSSYIYQFPDPTLQEDLTHKMFSSSESLQYYTFLSSYGEIFVWDPIRQSRTLLHHLSPDLLQCPLGHSLTFDGWDYDNVKYSLSFEGKLRFIFVSRLECKQCSNAEVKETETKPQCRFDSIAPFFFDRLPSFIREKFPLVLGLKRGVFSKEFLKAAHALRVGFHLPINSIQLVHRECVSNNLLVSQSISLSLISHLLFIPVFSILRTKINNAFSTVTPVLWKRDQELSLSTWKINRYLLRELNALEFFYISSLKDIQCKILRYDHTFKVASLVQVIKRGSNSFDHDQSTPYAAVLTTMNEEQKVPFFSFVASKSLTEVEDSLLSLCQRGLSPTNAIIGDNPMADCHFWRRILGESIQLFRDIFHVFQDLWREVKPSRHIDRKSCMAELWKCFFSVHSPDLILYKQHWFQQRALENSSLTPDQIILAWDSHENSPSFLKTAVESNRVRSILNSRNTILTRFKALVDREDGSNPETSLFKPTIRALVHSIESQVNSGYFDSLDSQTDLSDWFNIGTEQQPVWVNNRGTSQLESFHQLINPVLAGVSSPAVAHLVLLGYTFRFNSHKQNRFYHYQSQSKRPMTFDPRIFNSICNAISALNSFEKVQFPPAIAQEISSFSLAPVTLEEIKSNPSLQVGIYRDKWRYSMARLAFDSEQLTDSQFEALSSFIHANWSGSGIAPPSIHSLKKLSETKDLSNLPLRSDFVQSKAERGLMKQFLGDPKFLLPWAESGPFHKSTDFLRRFDIFFITIEFNLKLIKCIKFIDGIPMLDEISIQKRFITDDCVDGSGAEFLSFPLSHFTLKEVEHTRDFILSYGDMIIRDTHELAKTNSNSKAEHKANLKRRV
jgi:hypothetical protein